MRIATLYLVVAALACTGAAVRYALTASVPRSAPALATEAAALPPGVEVRNLLDPEFVEAEPLAGEEQRPGYLVFAPGEGETVTGVAAACLCPARQDVPSFDEAQNVVAVQEGDASLRLSEWIVERKPEGAWFLHYALWLDGAHGREWRTGWTSIAIGDVAARGCRVPAPARSAAIVDVVTADGDPIPSALVAVDDADFDPTNFRQYAFTDERGKVRISGLEAERAFLVSTPFGAGPCRLPSQELVTARPASVPVSLTVPLRGGWDWKRFRGAVPIPGAALQFESADLADDRLPVLWPSAPWVGPGQRSAPPIYVLHARGAALPASVELSFRGFAPLHVDPTVQDHRLAFRIEQPVAIRRPASGGDSR